MWPYSRHGYHYYKKNIRVNVLFKAQDTTVLQSKGVWIYRQAWSLSLSLPSTSRRLSRLLTSQAAQSLQQQLQRYKTIKSQWEVIWTCSGRSAEYMRVWCLSVWSNEAFWQKIDSGRGQMSVRWTCLKSLVGSGRVYTTVQWVKCCNYFMWPENSPLTESTGGGRVA